MKKFVYGILSALVLIMCFVVSPSSALAANENAVFPMDCLWITQGVNGGLSHQGNKALDVIGCTDGVIEDVKAPFTCKVVYISGTVVMIESIEPVIYADGTVDYMTIRFGHDDYTGDLSEGQEINQGVVFYQEGTAGYVTGIHLEFECARGRYTDGSVRWIDQTATYGNWTLSNSYLPFDALFLKPTTEVKNGLGYNWRYTDDTPVDPPVTNTAPIAGNDEVTTAEDTPVSIPVLTNDSDPDGDVLSISSVTQGANGSTAINGSNISYTPKNNWFGTDTFTYTASDGSLEFGTATVTVRVTSVNDAPELDPINDQTKEWNIAIDTITPVVTDPDTGDSHTFGLTGSLPNGVSFNSTTGVISGTPAKDSIGVYNLTLNVTDSAGASDSKDFTITVTKRTATLAITSTVSEAQYSDLVAGLTATLIDTQAEPDVPLAGQGILFTIGSQSATGTTDSTGKATASITLDQPQSSPGLTASLVANDYYVADDASQGFTINKEDAVASFDDILPSQLVETDGGTAPAFALTVDLREMVPDLPEGLSAPGDISKIIGSTVTMTLSPVGPGSGKTITGTFSDNNEDGYGGIVTATFNFPAGMTVNTYEVSVALNNNYYQVVDNASVFTVYDPSLGFTTGGGWFYWPGTDEKTNFGYTMKYGKKLDNLKGSLLVIRHVSDTELYRIKSNALSAGSLAIGSDSSDPENLMGWASFSGKCTYIEPGWEAKKGNVIFETYVEDQNGSGTGNDEFWLKVLGYPAMSLTSPGVGNSIPIEGGNIVVPHLPAKK